MIYTMKNLDFSVGGKTIHSGFIDDSKYFSGIAGNNPVSIDMASFNANKVSFNPTNDIEIVYERIVKTKSKQPRYVKVFTRYSISDAIIKKQRDCSFLIEGNLL